MRTSDLSKIYVYEPHETKRNGEVFITWSYKDSFYLNQQQDISELDRNTVGEIDYDVLHIRTRQQVDLEKGDGISLRKLNTENGTDVIDDRPDYLVQENPRIGRTTNFVCVRYHGE